MQNLDAPVTNMRYAMNIFAIAALFEALRGLTVC